MALQEHPSSSKLKKELAGYMIKLKEYNEKQYYKKGYILEIR